MWVDTKDDGSGRDDTMGLFGACVEGLMPLACLVGNLIAPSEKTSPRPPDNGWNPFYPEIKPMIWATACQRSNQSVLPRNLLSCARHFF